MPWLEPILVGWQAYTTIRRDLGLFFLLWENPYVNKSFCVLQVSTRSPSSPFYPRRNAFVSTKQTWPILHSNLKKNVFRTTAELRRLLDTKMSSFSKVKSVLCHPNFSFQIINSTATAKGGRARKWSENELFGSCRSCYLALAAICTIVLFQLLLCLKKLVAFDQYTIMCSLSHTRIEDVMCFLKASAATTALH